MAETIELNPGEVKIKFSKPVKGKVSLADLGIESKTLDFESGFVRIVFDMEGIGEHHYYQVPTIEVTYLKNQKETHWQVDFNRETIVDKTDHHGHSTILLMNRKKLSELEHHHENKLIVHAEFPESVSIDTAKTFIHFFI